MTTSIIWDLSIDYTIRSYTFLISSTFFTLSMLYFIYYLSYTYSVILNVSIMYYEYIALYCIVYIGIVAHVKYIS